MPKSKLSNFLQIRNQIEYSLLRDEYVWLSYMNEKDRQATKVEVSEV